MSDSTVIPKTVPDHQHEEQYPLAWQLRGCTTRERLTAPTGKSRLGGLHAILTNSDRMWDVGTTITCTFVRPVGTRIQQEKIKAVVKEWEQYANIKFQFVTDRNATIRISLNDDPRDPDGGSWSAVAKDAKETEWFKPGEATMNFGWITKGREITDEDKGVILHEFGHALGFLHEHQSSRRGEKLTLDEKAVIELFMRTQGWTEKDVREQVLDVVKDNEVSSFSSVDLTSIMMYFMPAELNLEHIEIKPNNKLDELDKAFAYLNYPFINTPSPSKQWTIEHALDVAGVQDDSRQRILSEFKEKDWRGVRAELALWSLNQRALAISNRLGKKRAAEATQATEKAPTDSQVAPAAPVPAS